jgi:hypothetical protein
MASIARAFSTRPRTSTSKSFQNKLSKSNSMRQQGVNISAPVLVSSTNAQTVISRDVSTANAQKHTLRKVSSVSSHSSVNSDGHSDHSSIPSRSRGASFTDNSSVGSSPSSPKTDNNATDLWGLRGHPSPRKAKSSADLKERAAATETREPVPPLPRSHNLSQNRLPTQSLPLNRKQSLQTLPTLPWQPPKHHVQPRPIPKSVPEPEIRRQTQASPDIFQGHQVASPHPFSKELRQLDQVAEDYRDAAFQEDTELMEQRGLYRFCADDYIRDLQPTFFHYFMPQPVSVGWI